MADNNSGNTKSFLIGALIVVVAGLGWYIYSGGDVPSADEPEIQIDLPDGNN
ncbi:DUF1071 domain-containing protein [Thioclava sp. SK-1]|uniref:Sak single strand annealing protein n=1 Tax=Thioclava sp. SK-1 TaxID=1889770 RepID=UPI00114CE510|nr:DUF1071 domain-containing protein [Thioclava sp. SK-1]